MALFHSRDFLDGDAAGPAIGTVPRAPVIGGMHDEQYSRPASSSGRPYTAGSSYSGGGDPGSSDNELEGAPPSASARRLKMQQQRQRTLQKQRLSSGGSAGGIASPMVVANEHLPSNEAGTPLAYRRPSTGASSDGESRPSLLRQQIDGDAPPLGLAQPTSGNSEHHGLYAPAVLANTPTGRGPPMVETAMSRMSLDEEDMGGLVHPDPAGLDTGDEDDQTRRRNILAQSLDERGISSIYDPTPHAGPGLPGRENSFDIGSIGPADMKSFLLSPSPKSAGMIECRIVRERNGLNKLFPKYTLESDSGIFLITAKKQKHNKTSNYQISMSKTETLIGKETESSLGKLRSNFLGLEFIAYGTGLNPKKIDPTMQQVHAIQLARQELIAVQYSSSLWGSKPRGPRKMSAVIPRVQPSGERIVCRTLHPETEGLLALQKAGPLVDVYQNKPPKWNEQIGAFVLNFNKRVTQASVKNFQLTNSEDPDTVYLQFGRVGKDVFNMDFRFPFSPFQAFAICLSSFDYKLCCE